MKVKEKRVIRSVLILWVMCALILNGCGAKNSEMTEDIQKAEDYAEENNFSMDSYSGEAALAEEPEVSAEGDTGEKSSVISEGAAAAQEGRKLIRDASLEIETKEFNDFIEKIEQEAAEMGGYIESSSVSGNSYNGGDSERSAWFTLRIPADRLEAFITRAGENGNVVNVSRNVRDITLEYVDTEGRIGTLQAELDRLNTLLAQAASMEDMLAIEARISDVRYELESWQSQMNTYNNLVDYSTVHMNVREVVFVSANSGQSVWEKIQNGFMNSIYGLGRGISGFFIGLVIGIPYIAVAVAVIVLTTKLVRRIGKKRKNKDDKEEN